MSDPYRDVQSPKYKVVNQGYAAKSGWTVALEKAINEASKDGYRYLNHTDTAGAVTVIMVKE